MTLSPAIPSTSRAPTARKAHGLQVRVHVSWTLMALFVAWSLAAGALPMIYLGLPGDAYWTTVALIAVGLAGSVALHELAHIAAARVMGRGAPRLTLFLFGSMAELGQEPDDWVSELLIALSGPAASLALALGMAGFAGSGGLAAWPESVGSTLLYVATFNLVLAAFNMAPAYPLDGGRVVRALAWAITRDLDRATTIACRVGEAVAWLLILGGVAALFTVDLVSGLWWILVGGFLRGAARAARLDVEARRHFAGAPVAELMGRSLETAAADLTLDRFVDERLLRSRHAAYPVVADGHFLGVIAPEQVLAVPRADWAAATVGATCAPAADVATARVDEDAGEVLRRMHALDVTHMPVLHGETVVGMITLRDLVGSFDLWRRFRPQAV